MSGPAISVKELREYERDILNADLRYFAGKLVMAAEKGHRQTVHVKTFTVAVGAAAMFARRSFHEIARTILQDINGLDTVQHTYPEISQRNASEWQDAMDEVWQTVKYRDETSVPEDRSIVGHIELLDALAYHKAYFKT